MPGPIPQTRPPRPDFTRRDAPSRRRDAFFPKASPLFLVRRGVSVGARWKSSRRAKGDSRPPPFRDIGILICCTLRRGSCVPDGSSRPTRMGNAFPQKGSQKRRESFTARTASSRWSAIHRLISCWLPSWERRGFAALGRPLMQASRWPWRTRRRSSWRAPSSPSWHAHAACKSYRSTGEHCGITQCLASGKASEVERGCIDRERGAVPRVATRCDAAGHRRRGARPSNLEHGPQNHCRLGDDDEQGTRDRRSTMAV